MCRTYVTRLRRGWQLLLVAALLSPPVAAADVDRRVMNNGNLVLEGIPEIPTAVVADLLRFQNVRSARFRDWGDEGQGIFVSTGFGAVDSIHQVAMPLGSRRQLTFYAEPVSEITSRPGGNSMVFARDVGGNEFTQLFLFDPETSDELLLTDGESKNDTPVWDRRGTRLAFRSTRRNGVSNDIWLLDPEAPAAAGLVLASPDGTYWEPTEFSARGSKLLLRNYVSITDSTVQLLDLDSGELEVLAGGGSMSSNKPVAFDDAGNGFWFITDQGGEFSQLAWQSLEAGAAPEIVTADIRWDVEDAGISHDRERLYFVVNEEGYSRLYLLDAVTRRYRPVDNLPLGRVYGLKFSPDDRMLGMSLTTPQAPSDAFTLLLGDEPLAYGSLTRWTVSEIGGLDSGRFRAPELVHYPTFDVVDGEYRRTPAWVYKPAGRGPFPVIVVIHGGPESQSRPTFSTTIQMWLDKLGVAVVLPNVRGSNGYGKTYLGLDNTYHREDAVQDIGALLDWIAQRPDLDAGRVAVYGGSYGGYMALASAVHYSDRLRAAVDSVGISNFVTFLENTQDYRRDLRRQEYGDERDPEMRAFLESISPLNNVERIRIPVFISQGENDPRVPVSEAEQMVNALRRQGQDVWYMNALDEGHGYRKRNNRDVQQQVMMMFFREYLLDEQETQ